jgi:LVIVD repeat
LRVGFKKEGEMVRGVRFGVGALVWALVLVFAMTAAGDPGSGGNRRVIGDDVANSPVEVHALHAQHGQPGGHLPGSSKNVQLVGQVDIEGAAPDRVADVAAYGNYAYLSVRDPQGCSDAGFAVIDISDPFNPRQVGFIDSTEGSFPGEGAHVIDVKTKFFRGQILLGNNEICAEGGEGGVSLWDVTDPLNPQVLTAHAGDPDAGEAGEPHQFNHIHSVFGWQQGKRAFAVLVDNMEFTDVDIIEITDPRNPVLLTELDLTEFDIVQPELLEHGNFQAIFHHDVIVKKVRGTWTMLVSYWDGGWVLLNVNDPANPSFINDTDYTFPDPLFPNIEVPEGNAHQAEFGRRNRLFIGTDEDFSPYRLLDDSFGVTSGPNAGQYRGGEFGWTKQIATYPDGQVNGPTIYGGYGCPDVGIDGTDYPAPFDDPIPPASTLPAGPGEEKVVVLLRGECFFSEKVEQAQLAGYDAVLIANSHAGAADGAAPDAALCGSQAHEFTITIAAVCTGHRAFHLMFNQTPTYEGADEPPLGTLGPTVLVQSEFDGWGYVHLYDSRTMEEIDVYAIDEAMDPAFASGFGDLTVHEVAVDPFRRGLAYLSYYAGGFRVIKYNRNGIREVGHFIDEEGNDFWGVQVHRLPQAVNGVRKVVLASDRDSGLWIFRYTGP